MPELAGVEKQKTAGFVNPKYSRSEARKKKIEQEEQELEELIKQSSGKTDGGDTGDNPPDGEADLDQETQKAKPKAKEDEHSSEKTKEASETEEENLSAEEKSFKKRYGDLRRYLQKKEKEWEEKLEKISKNELQPPASEEDIKKWQEKYPQVAKIIETVAQKQAQEMFDKADARLKEFDEFAYEAEREKSLREIRKVHEDFDELRESEDFHEWADDQPKWVQDALYVNEDDPRSVIRVIDLYKVDKGITRKDRKKVEKEAASQVAPKNVRTKVDADEAGRKIKESDVAKMSDKEFEEKSDEIQEAMRSGNFIYDMTGAAR